MTSPPVGDISGEMQIIRDALGRLEKLYNERVMHVAMMLRDEADKWEKLAASAKTTERRRSNLILVQRFREFANRIEPRGSSNA